MHADLALNLEFGVSEILGNVQATMKKKNPNYELPPELEGDEDEETSEDETKKPQYGGTDANLRKIPIPELDVILLNLGISEAEVASMTRWDRTWIVEVVASSAMGATILNGSIAKYARDHRDTSQSPKLSKKRQTAYEQNIFERGLKMLEVEPDLDEDMDSTDDSSDDEAFERSLVNDMKLNMEAQQRQKKDKLHVKHNVDLQLSTEQLALEKLQKKQQAHSQTKKKDWLIPVPKTFQPFQVLKRTVVVMEPDGGEGRTYVEYHKSKEAILQYRRRKDQEIRQRTNLAAQGKTRIKRSRAFAGERASKRQFLEPKKKSKHIAAAPNSKRERP